MQRTSDQGACTKNHQYIIVFRILLNYNNTDDSGNDDGQSIYGSAHQDTSSEQDSNLVVSSCDLNDSPRNCPDRQPFQYLN